jgi:two-component system LytT family response regulator
MKGLLSTLQRDRVSVERILIRSAGRIAILPVDQIDWVESAGNYVKLHSGKETHLLRETMTQMEDRLDKTMFARIHRTAIVKIDRIKELRPHFHGDYQVVLHTGVKLTLSRRYRDRLSGLLDGL